MTLLELGHLNIQLCVDGYATVGGHDAGTAGVALPQQEGSAVHQRGDWGCCRRPVLPRENWGSIWGEG